MSERDMAAHDRLLMEWAARAAAYDEAERAYNEAERRLGELGEPVDEADDTIVFTLIAEAAAGRMVLHTRPAFGLWFEESREFRGEQFWIGLTRAGYAEYSPERGRWRALDVPVCRRLIGALWPDADYLDRLDQWDDDEVTES